MIEPKDAGDLTASAPLARRWAGEFCWRDAQSGKSCAAYHSIWQYLRIIGVVTTLDRHAFLYEEALRQLAADPAGRRVLLSGSADYGLLAVVAEAYRKAKFDPEITLVDRCETPLKLARWYGEKHNVSITTHQADLLDFSDPNGFDVICVHSLAGLVPAAQRGAMARSWFALLRPGGKVLFINAVSPEHHPPVVRYSPEQQMDHKARVEEAARRHSSELDLSPESLGAMAEAYSASLESNLIRSREEVLGLFEAAGFVIDSQRFGPFGIDDTHHFSGPTPPEKREYAWIEARRPQA